MGCQISRKHLPFFFLVQVPMPLPLLVQLLLGSHISRDKSWIPACSLTALPHAVPLHLRVALSNTALVLGFQQEVGLLEEAPL